MEVLGFRENKVTNEFGTRREFTGSKNGKPG